VRRVWGGTGRGSAGGHDVKRQVADLGKESEEKASRVGLMEGDLCRLSGDAGQGKRGREACYARF
jgi:hypothetical protein